MARARSIASARAREVARLARLSASALAQHSSPRALPQEPSRFQPDRGRGVGGRTDRLWVLRHPDEPIAATSARRSIVIAGFSYSGEGETGEGKG